MQRIIISLFLAALLISASHPVGPQTDPHTLQNDLQILSSDAARLSLRLRTPSYELLPASAEGDARALEGYFALHAPGLVSLGEPGEPELPRTSKLIGVPPGAEIEVVVRPGRAVSISGNYSLAPAPRVETGDGELLQAVQVFEADPQAYARQDLMPSALAQIGDVFWLRSQRVARIDLSPFQYLPARGTILWYPELEVDVVFNLTRGADPFVMRQASLLESGDPLEAALSSALVNGDQARHWQIDPGATANGLVAEPTTPTTLTQSSLKITTDRDGVYRLTYSQLQDAGLNMTGLDPAKLKLENQGREVAIFVDGAEDGTFDHDDYILFYGEQFRGQYMASEYYQDEDQYWVTYLRQYSDGTYGPWKGEYNHIMTEQYTKDNVYWLSVQATPGLRITHINGNPTGSSAPTPTSYRITERAEESRFYHTYHFTGEDVWFWSLVRGVQLGIFTTTLTSVVSTTQPVVLRGEMVATTHSATVSPDQNTRLYWNNTTTPLIDETWDGISRYRFETNLSASDLKEGFNNLYMRGITITNIIPRYYFDWYEVEYDRAYDAQNDALAFSPSAAGEWKYVVNRFSTPDLVAFDISSPLQPVSILNSEINPAGMEFSASFAVTSTETSRYIIAGGSAILSPKSMTSYSPHLRTAVSGADYIFISHPSFITATQVLADYRTSRGLRTQIVSIEDIYNEFSFGITQPLAIKDFLRWVFQNWEAPAPTYVALVGDGHYNPREFAPDRMGTAPAYMLPYFAYVDKEIGLVDATNLLGAVVGDDALADVALSRIPVNSPAEMKVIVDKIMAYESAPVQEWQRNLMFVSDYPDLSAGDFEHSAEQLIGNYVHSGFTAERIYASEYGNSLPDSCTGTCAALAQSLNTNGALLMVYAGHGAVKYWGNTLFNVSHVSSLTNARLPVLMTLDCWDGHWYGITGPVTGSPLVDTSPSLSEAMLRKEGGGIVAAYSPVGLSYSFGHDLQADAFFESIFENGSWTLGSAVYAAKLRLLTLNLYTDQIQTYNILGDPALKISSPYRLQASTWPSSRSSEAGTQASYAVTITNTGALIDTYSLSVTGNLWPTSPGTPITLAPGQSGDASITVTIPLAAGIGTRDFASVTVVSSGDKAQTAAFRLTTTALNPNRVLIPVLFNLRP